MQTAHGPIHANPVSRFFERIGLALSPGGAGASAWWFTNRVLRLDVYRLVARRHAADASRQLPKNRFDFRSISTLDDVRALPEGVVGALEAHTSRDLSELVKGGSRVYFLASGEQVACQLVASGGGEARMDTPRGLYLGPGPNGAIISYVYTHPSFRRMGAARELLLRIEEDLAARGITFLAAHVSVTNVPSLQTFVKAGWESLGLIGFSQKGKLVFSRLRAGNPLGVRTEARPRPLAAD